MTSFFIIGDTHIKENNLSDIDIFIDKIVIEIKNRKPDIIVLLGDILHTHSRIHTSCLNKAYILIEKLSQITYTYVIVGNHDFESNQIFLEDKHWMNGLKKWENVEIVDKPIIKSIKGSKFTMVPYVYPGRFIEALDTLDDWKESTCIFGHQQFYGSICSFISEGDEWDITFPLVISGHIHSKKWLQKNIYYTGASIQDSFGEEDNNSVVMFTFDNNGYTYDEIELDVPKKKTVNSNIDDVNDIDIDKITNSFRDNLRISIKGNYEEFKSFKKTKKYKELQSKNIKIDFKPSITEPILYENKNKTFMEILYEMISEENDTNLVELYNYIL